MQAFPSRSGFGPRLRIYSRWVAQVNDGLPRWGARRHVVLCELGTPDENANATLGALAWTSMVWSIKPSALRSARKASLPPSEAEPQSLMAPRFSRSAPTSSSAFVFLQPLFFLEACKHTCKCACEQKSALSPFGETRPVLHVRSSSWAGKRIYSYYYDFHYCYYSYSCYSSLLVTVALICSASVPYNPLSCMHALFLFLDACTWHTHGMSIRTPVILVTVAQTNRRVCVDSLSTIRRTGSGILSYCLLGSSRLLM